MLRQKVVTITAVTKVTVGAITDLKLLGDSVDAVLPV